MERYLKHNFKPDLPDFLTGRALLRKYPQFLESIDGVVDDDNRFVGAKFSGDFVFFRRCWRNFELRFFVAILKSPENSQCPSKIERC